MRRLTVGRIVAGGVAVLVLAAAGTGTAFAVTANSGSSYRTAVAAIGDVAETLALTGSVESAARRDQSFAVAGTVDAVDVTLGQHVDAGATLATIGTGDLQSALDAANDTLADAKQQLADDLEAQTSSSSSTSSGSTTTASTGSSPAGASSGTTVDTAALQQAAAAVQQRQQSLLAAITAAGTAVTQADTDRTAATTACSTVTDPTDPGYIDVSTLDPSDSGDQAALVAAQTALAACQAALATVATDQAAVQTAQAAVQTASQDLDTSITALQAAAQPVGTGTGNTGSGGTGSGGTGSNGASGASGGAQGAGATQTASTRTPSSADIVADRAAIDAAQSQVGIAQHDVDAHVLTAAISGTVAQIAVAVGDSVSAGSSSQVITILGDDGYVITTTVTLSQVAKVAVGQTATVELPALGTSYPGKVASVGVTNVATDSSTPSYDVTIAIDAGTDAIREGSAADVEVAVASVTGVLTVPLSAVTTSAGASTVELLQGGRTTTTKVAVGAVGDELAEIDSGLAAGDVVVIADLSEGVPSSTTSTTRGSGLTSLTGGGTTGFTGRGTGFTGTSGSFGGTGTGGTRGTGAGG